MNRAVLLALATLLILLSSTVTAATHVVLIERMSYRLITTEEIRVGDRIEWRNRDVVPHTATLRQGGPDINIDPGESKTTEVTFAGDLNFYCRYHPTMELELVVKD